MLLFIAIEQGVAVSGMQFADQPPKVDPGAGVAVSLLQQHGGTRRSSGRPRMCAFSCLNCPTRFRTCRLKLFHNRIVEE